MRVAAMLGLRPDFEIQRAILQLKLFNLWLSTEQSEAQKSSTFFVNGASAPNLCNTTINWSHHGIAMPITHSQTGVAFLLCHYLHKPPVVALDIVDEGVEKQKAMYLGTWSSAHRRE
jgi:hypothetical protein